MNFHPYSPLYGNFEIIFYGTLNFVTSEIMHHPTCHTSFLDATLPPTFEKLQRKDIHLHVNGIYGSSMTLNMPHL